MALTVIDFEDASWQTYFSGDWVIDDQSSTPPKSGSRALRSAPISHGQSSTTTLSIGHLAVEGALLKVTVWYRVSSESGYDELTIDPGLAPTSGNVLWTELVLMGADTITFTYQKDGSSSAGEDAAFIDEIHVESFTLSLGNIDVPDVLALGYNPNPIPLPNPDAVGPDGLLTVVGLVGVEGVAVIDQVDGGGGVGGKPGGGPADPARMGVITGTVTDENGNPVARRVRCFERLTGRLVRETWSDEAGAYRFDDLDPAKAWTIMAMDYTGEHNAVVADWARSEVPT